ncbi:C1 family peptidase [Pseudomonas lopnurensis]|uniref:C1 family peptidase n=1 Tax=Pseudomonas lopnurensis TaxID=1477517 RepID=UPI0028AD37C6|nr:C1 family peptidase [Pseudomonas lopnurensis]
MINVEVLLGEFASPARPQGPRPTCLAFALSDLNRRFSPTDLSPEYFYQTAARLIPGWKPGDGLQFDAAQQASLLGQPEEERYPYCEHEPDIPIPELPGDLPMYGRALKLEYADLTVMASTLRAGRPVGLGLRVTREFYVPDNGVVSFSDHVVPGMLHAVVAIGLGRHDEDASPWFYVRNSWGPDWGIQGHAWISGAYVAAHAACAFGVDHGETDTQ